MSPKKHTEVKFEDAIEASLLASGGYEKGDPATFDRARALDPTVLLPFIQATQPKVWAAVESFHGADTEKVLLDDLGKALASDAQGLLNVLRHGFKCFGKTVRVAWFAPASGMNPEAKARYDANRLSVTRQLKYSEKGDKSAGSGFGQPQAAGTGRARDGAAQQSLDLVLSVNGLPVVTVELKNPMSGQSAEHAKAQYRKDRDPREPIFRFKRGALVHFAVDPDTAWMSTRLEGASTRFLPFNRGRDGGAGNPDAAGYRTAYLWESVWRRDSLLDILARFVHLQVEESKVATAKGVKTRRSEALIFPRYHQLDAVRRMVAHAREHGAGRNYLVQHSAGSGKTNTIAWLAHRLASLHDAADAKVFDSVVVITDRVVLDRQLQDTIYQFEHKQGVVKKIDEDSGQLAAALADGTPIVITTLQKFPFVTEKVGTLPGRRYAVIVDEAHSSQSGETATDLKGVLAGAEIRAQAKAQAGEEGVEDDGEEAILRTMLKRGRQPNLSFFAFTATPKYKTYKIFDEPGVDGAPPFHLYRMRQAIEEGFILDVLAHYVTYKAYFRLIKSIADDPEVDKGRAARALARFMKLHPHNLAQKTEVMVEHFRAHTRHKIGGRAKAMVVTDSRLAAVRYKQHFDRYISEKGYEGIRTLVAFSGSVDDPDAPGVSYTEPGMNEGIKEKELKDKFASESYHVLIVAEKYQTGFDQPLLHTMYVDKRLAGIQAVQTLSRLNRTAAGKEDTFVLDFVNEREEIHDAFKPYYERTPMGEDVDPHKLYELQAQLDGHHVYHGDEVEAFCKVYFAPKAKETAGDHAKLNACLDPAVGRFAALDEDTREAFRSLLVGFRNLYEFLAQIIPYQDSDLEKLYTYLRFLHRKLPRRDAGDAVHVEDDVKLAYYRLQKISEGSIDLSVGETPPLYGPTDVGTGKVRDDTVELSQLIDLLNDRFGTEFTQADQLFFDQVREEAAADEKLRQAALVNRIEDFQHVFDKALEDLFLERMEGNEEIFMRLMNDDAFRSVAGAHLLREVYNQIRGSGGGA